MCERGKMKEKEIAHAPLKNKKLSIVNENLSYLCYLGNLRLVCRAIPATRKLREYNHTEEKTCTTYTTEIPPYPLQRILPQMNEKNTKNLIEEWTKYMDR